MSSTNNMPAAARLPLRVKFGDILVLTKFELTGLSVLTALCGFYIATGSIDLGVFFWTGVGTWLLAAAASVFNQFQERIYDGMMRRTERRPLPAGRISPTGALVVGVLTLVAGSVVLYTLANPLAMTLGVVTVAIYVALYTPMKRRTPLATAIGAVPGAMPPLIGWGAATGTLDAGAWLLFALVYFWQVPHFLAIAWMYQKDYLRAGFRVLSVSDTNGVQTARLVFLATAVLLPVSLCLFLVGEAGFAYLGGAALLGGAFLVEAGRFYVAVSKAEGPWLGRANQVSRRLFYASLIYLPIVIILLAADKK